MLLLDKYINIEEKIDYFSEVEWGILVSKLSVATKHSNQ